MSKEKKKSKGKFPDYIAKPFIRTAVITLVAGALSYLALFIRRLWFGS